MARMLFLAAFALAACGGGEHRTPFPNLSKEPLSVRGWIADVEGAAPADKTIETEMARRNELFKSMNIWVENAPYISGGIAENGAFILLDVPPGNVTVSFSAPGLAKAAHLVLQNIPGNADLLIPNVLLKKNGTVALLQPDAVKVRIPAEVPAPLPTDQTVTIADKTVFVVKTPIAALVDRRDYPDPGGLHPVATYR